jgi:pimeloyl-ACP methyl ester carboxylesterase
MLPAEEPELLAKAIGEWWRTTESGLGLVPTELPHGPLPDYEVHGEGDVTLFLLHGAYGDRYYFDDAITRWTGAGLRVVAWTCPGYGPLEEVPDGYGVPLLAEYAARMVMAERTAQNVLLGHSMGGLIGPRVPALVGDTLNGLILSSASPGFVNRTDEDKQKYLVERVKPITEDGLSVAEYAVGLLRTMMAPGASGPLVDRVIEVITAMKTESFIASMRAITEYNSVPSLKALRIPTLMLPGAHDPACTPAGMQKMRDMVSRASYHEIAGAGHYAFAERPDEYHAVTTSFITSVTNLAALAR